MPQRDEIESQIIKETQYSFKEEATKKSSQDDPKKEEFSQKPQTSEQMTTPTTPRARVEPPRTPPMAAQPDSPPQDPGPQSSHTQSDDDGSEQSEEVILQEPKDDEVEPHTLPYFDWEALEAEYVDAMDRANNAELELGEEFKQLANFFATWSNVSYSEDQSRATKRFKTRREHVLHSEEMFEAKKQHYEKVVEAFKVAVELLQSD